MGNPYIPTTDSGLYDWSGNFSGLITANPTNYGLQASDALTIQNAADAYRAAYVIATTPSTRTSATIAAKNAAKTAALATFRPYAQNIKANAGVSDALKVGLGLNLDDQTRTPVPPPVTNPLLAVVGATTLSQTLRYADVTTPDKRKKPEGAKFLFLFRTIAATPATDPNAAKFYNAITTQPVEVTFDAGDVGKLCTYWACWANTKGQRGPWSPAVTFGIV